MKKLEVIDKCPCCGEVAIMKYDDSTLQSYYGFPSTYIQCQGCGLRTDCGREDEIVPKWNRRIYNEN